MCKLKSAIILKDRVFMPDYDSHSDMLAELGIKDDYLGASKKFVRAELSPTDGDVFSDIETWAFCVDQDITPEWFVADEYKPRMVEAAKEWAKTHIHIGVDGLKIDSGKNHYIKDCKNVEVCGNGVVEWVSGNGVVEWVSGNGVVKQVYGNGVVKQVYGNGVVKQVSGNGVVKQVSGNGVVEWVSGNGVVEWVSENGVVKQVSGNGVVKQVSGNGVVEWVSGNGVVISSPYSRWNNADSLILTDNATLKDNIGKVIYQSGDFKLISVESGKKISESEENK